MLVREQQGRKRYWDRLKGDRSTLLPPSKREGEPADAGCVAVEAACRLATAPSPDLGPWSCGLYSDIVAQVLTEATATALVQPIDDATKNAVSNVYCVHWRARRVCPTTWWTELLQHHLSLRKVFTFQWHVMTDQPGEFLPWQKTLLFLKLPAKRSNCTRRVLGFLFFQ